MTVIDLKTGERFPLPKEGAVFALGNFDGVHLGHRKVLERAIKCAGELGVKSAAWCLSRPSSASGEILTDDGEKTALLASLGLDFAVFEDFDAVKDMSGEEFVNEYLASLGCRGTVCGFNFRFGKGAASDCTELEKLCSKNGMTSYTEEAVFVDGKAVSSTRIKALLKEGAVSDAAKLLARPVSVGGKVARGRALGKSFGFPTVNISLAEGRAQIRNGVYYTVACVDGQRLPSVSNVGFRPTVNGHEKRLECHIFGFDRDIYGEYVAVELTEFRRDEKKFSSPEELISEIKNDIAGAEKFFSLC